MDDGLTDADDTPAAWAADRYGLQQRYLELTRELLPREATKRGWRLREDHCFMRVLLDDVCGDDWRRVLDRRLVAYKQLTNEQLRQAIHAAECILAGDEAFLDELNRRSLGCRVRGG